MQIDKSKIVWDAPDPKSVQWDDAPAPEKTLKDRVAGGIRAVTGPVNNHLMGLVQGVADIGGTLLAPGDALTGYTNRRADISGGVKATGVDPNSISFKSGRLNANVAGVVGAGPALGGVAKLAGAASPVVNALSSGGFVGGGNALTRATAGGAVGGASAALIDPNTAGTGFMIGGLLPGSAQVAGWTGNAISQLLEKGSQRLMQSAIKPTIAQLKSGDASTTIQTLLQYGINPTKGGVNKLQQLIDDLNTQISNAVGSSTATVSKQKVLDTLSGVRTKFTNQVSPTSDLNAIKGVSDDFAAHPNLAAGDAIPVQAAQDMKQGTYKVLSKKYGQLGSAETEAQKGLARGLKEEIATAVPGVAALNAEESRLITTLKVAERRSLMELNKNPMGLAALAGSPTNWALFMADKSALFKSLAARMVNASAGSAAGAGGSAQALLANPTARTLAIEASQAGQR